MKNKGLLPPQSPDIEIFVLGAMMINNLAAAQAVEVLSPEVFYLEKNKIIFNAITNIFNSDKAIDFVSVSEEIKRMNQSHFVDTMYLSHVCLATPTSAGLEEKCNILREYHIKRIAIVNAEKTLIDAYDNSTDALELLQKQQNDIDALQEINTNTIHTPAKQVEVLKKNYEYGLTNKSHFPKFGIGVWDRNFPPFLPGNLIYIGARPSVGKTSLAISIAKNMSNAGVPVGFFSLEMTAYELIVKELAMERNVSSEIIFSGAYDAAINREVETFAEKLPNTNIYIDDSDSLNEITLFAKIKRLVTLYGVKVVFLDYIGLMDCSVKKNSREAEISLISRKIKRIAKKLNITIFVLVQINRKAEEGKYPTPELHHLRDSGSTEQDADAVILIDRPEKYGLTTFEDKASCVGKARLILAKRRGGKTGIATVSFKAETTEFYDNNDDYGPNELSYQYNDNGYLTDDDVPAF